MTGALTAIDAKDFHPSRSRPTRGRESRRRRRRSHPYGRPDAGCRAAKRTSMVGAECSATAYSRNESYAPKRPAIGVSNIGVIAENIWAYRVLRVLPPFGPRAGYRKLNRSVAKRAQTTLVECGSWRLEPNSGKPMSPRQRSHFEIAIRCEKVLNRLYTPSRSGCAVL